MNDIFSYVIKPYLESKEVGWSPFELHIVDNKIPVGTKIDNAEFKSFRCLLKKIYENGNTRYYDLTPDANEDGTLPCVSPRIMTLRNVYSNYAGITSFGRWNSICYIIIVNRSNRTVVSCSGTLFPMNDRALYMKQFSNMFKRFDSMVIESNVESIIKKRFEN